MQCGRLNYCHDLIVAKYNFPPLDLGLDCVSCLSQSDVSTHDTSGGFVCACMIGLVYLHFSVHQGGQHNSLATAARMRNEELVTCPWNRSKPTL